MGQYSWIRVGARLWVRQLERPLLSRGLTTQGLGPGGSAPVPRASHHSTTGREPFQYFDSNTSPLGAHLHAGRAGRMSPQQGLPGKAAGWGCLAGSVEVAKIGQPARAPQRVDPRHILWE